MTFDQSLLLSLAVHNVRQQIHQTPLLRLPAQQLTSALGLAPRISTPQVASHRKELICVIGRDSIDLICINKFLLMCNLGNGLANVTPGKGASLGEVVAILVPCCFATFRLQGRRDQAKEYVAQISNV